MLSVNFDKKQQRLDVHFDMPFPDELEGHDEWKVLKQNLHDLGRAEFQRLNGQLAGLTFDAAGWMDFLKGSLPQEEFTMQREFFDALVKQQTDKQGEGLQVNFHQNPFDSPERSWHFILNQGNFLLYFLNRVNWYLGPENRVVAPFPLHVDLESASTCNMNCPMCYRDMLDETGQMEVDLFKKGIDECAENKVFSVRLSWRGETLTHPRIKEMIAYAAERIPNVSFLTNAFFLEEDITDCLIDCGVSYVAVSFDGIAETYEKIRRPAKFRENYMRLARLKAKREKADTKLPQIRLCTIWPAIKDDPDAYYKTMKEVSDYIVCNPYINFKGPMTVKPDFICQYPWERLVVAFNGKTQCCTGWNADDIILGNLKDETLADMWHSEQMHRIRGLHAQGRRMELNSCARCRHGSKGDPNVSIDQIIERSW
jgi:radical SAM protein with 4Fe4S-binding SPASM domain